jgi:hypothetical protein
MSVTSTSSPLITSTPLHSTPLNSPHQNFRQPPPAGGMGSFNTLERPASRLEINAMERELEERVRLVLEKRGGGGAQQQMQQQGGEDDGTGYNMGLTYQPYKESMILLREQILTDLVGDAAVFPVFAAAVFAVVFVVVIVVFAVIAVDDE